MAVVAPIIADIGNAVVDRPFKDVLETSRAATKKLAMPSIGIASVIASAYVAAKVMNILADSNKEKMV